MFALQTTQFHEFPKKLPLKKSTVTQQVFNFLALAIGLGNVSVISEKEVSTSFVFRLNQLVWRLPAFPPPPVLAFILGRARWSTFVYWWRWSWKESTLLIVKVHGLGIRRPN